MSEAFKEEMLIGPNDGWQTLHWADWKIAVRDKTIDQYLEKQTKEAVVCYYHKTIEEIPGYDSSKKLGEQNGDASKAICEALIAFGSHADPISGLHGNENFARKNLMYRSDLPIEEIEKRYKEWEEKELHHEEIKTLTK